MEEFTAGKTYTNNMRTTIHQVRAFNLMHPFMRYMKLRHSQDQRDQIITSASYNLLEKRYKPVVK